MDERVLHSFLDDIKANPLEDTPRLILADWLEEHGETEAERARGTFLRAQCQEDVTVAEDLLTRHRTAGVGELDRVPLAGVSFERGLVHVMGLLAQLLDDQLATEPTWKWVEALEVVGQEGRLSPLWRQPWLDEVSTLRLNARPEWGHVQLARLLGSRRLSRLRGLVFFEQHLTGDRLAQL